MHNGVYGTRMENQRFYGITLMEHAKGNQLSGMKAEKADGRQHSQMESLTAIGINGMKPDFTPNIVSIQMGK